MKKLLVTGSGGLIGSEAVAFFAAESAKVHGVDNNLRADFFGVELHGFLSYLIKCNLERNASRPASPESLSGPGDDRNCSALRQICCRLS
jgi:nucleoside-diphosphate-sugar epimerase